MKTKLCNTCKRKKPLFNFYKNHRTKDGLSNICSDCKSRRRTVIQEMHYNAKRRAKTRGIEFSITIDDIREINKKQNGKCAYSGMTLNWDLHQKGSDRYIAPLDRASLDRIDSSKGYTKDNIQLLTDLVNRMKYTQSYQELVKTCQLIVDGAK